MRVVLIGGYGFIGAHLGRAFLNRGDTLVALGRSQGLGRRILPDAEWHPIDLNGPLDPSQIQMTFAGADCVINASGALQSGGGESLGRIQTDSICALIDAAVAAGVPRFIQISAVGAAIESHSEFLATKGRADAYLAESEIDHAIVRPGLVIARYSFGGTALIRLLAALPFIRLKSAIKAPIQCVTMHDLTAAIVRLAASPERLEASIDLVAPERHSLDSLVDLHREWLQLPRPRWSFHGGRFLPVMTALSDVLSHFGWRSALRSNAVESLRSGIGGDPEPMSALLGRPAESLREFVRNDPLGSAERLSARLALLLPLAMLTLFLLWVGTGIVTLARPEAAAALLIGQDGIPFEAQAMTVPLALWDILLGMMLLWRRLARPAIAAMACTTLAYIVGGSILAPFLWLDPLGPLLKLLPILVLYGFCWAALEER